MTETIEIRTLLMSLGIGPKYRGFQYTIYAVTLTLEDEERLFSVTRSLYGDVAAHFSTTWNCVERNIRTVIAVCWKNNREKLEEIASYHMTKQPTPADFISILYNHLYRKISA